MNAPMNLRSSAAPGEPTVVRSLEQRRVRFYMGMLLTDVAILLGSFALAGWAYGPGLGPRSILLEGELLLPLFLTLALLKDVYSIRALEDWRYGAARTLWALGVAAALLIFMTFLLKSTATFSRLVFTGGLVAAATGLVASRALIGLWIARAWRARVTNVMYIDAGGPDVRVNKALCIDARAHDLVARSHDPVARDRLGSLLLNIERVVVSCPYEDRLEWAQLLRASGVRGEVVTDRLNELAPLGLVVEDDWRSLIVSTGPLGLRQRIMKRGFDTVLGFAGVVVLAPLMMAVAIAIRLEDGGPILFVQRRLGRGNRSFPMLKFRSMRADPAGRDGDRSAAPDDDRLTRVGRFIRRTSIDELPQLINVLRGDMSIVGPRPHALGSQAGSKLFWEVDRAYWNRHSLRPGLTGLAQVRGHRGATDEEKHLTDRLDADLEYIRTWSLRGDAWIVLQTLGVLVHPRAY